MFPYESGISFVADQLIKVWFPVKHNDSEWINSEDGISWREIALLDAEVCVNAYKRFMGDDLK